MRKVGRAAGPLLQRAGHWGTRNRLAPEYRQQQAKQDAEYDAGDDGKIKGGVLALDPDVAR